TGKQVRQTAQVSFEKHRSISRKDLRVSHFIFVQKLLSANNLTKSFGNFTALDGVSFMVKKGSTSLLLGPNGAGKSTIIKCILGMFHFKGEIHVDGFDVRRDGKKARTKIGYVPQQLSFYSTLTVEQQAKFIAQVKKIDDRVVHEKLESMGLWDLRARKVKALSSGEKQRFGISMA